MIPVIIGVLFLVFAINAFTPGDPVAAMLGNSYTQEEYDAKTVELGLDKPWPVQFLSYLKGVVTEFDLGTSYQSHRHVRDELFERFPTTFKLGVIGICVTIIIGIPLGIVSATKQYSVLDYAATTTSLFFASMPSFWVALMLIILFSLKLKLFPASGLMDWKGWVLPAIAVGLAPVANVTRITRSGMLEVIRQDYIRTARAKGQSEGVIVRKHALKNALIPVVTVIGYMLGGIMGGTVVVEAIFTIPGVGSYLQAGINYRDYPVIQGTIVLLSLVVCVMNLLVDLAYAMIDPRIKAQYVSRGKGSRKKKKASGEA